MLCGTTHVYPFNGNVGFLTDIRQGGYREKTFACDEQSYDCIYGPIDEAREYVQALKKETSSVRKWIERGYIYVELVTVQVRYEYVVMMWLTEIGEACFNVLRRGEVWSLETQAADIETTIAYYEKYLEASSISNEVFKSIVTLPSPTYDRLSSAFVMRKLQSEPVEGRSDLWKVSA